MSLCAYLLEPELVVYIAFQAVVIDAGMRQAIFYSLNAPFCFELSFV